MLSTFSVPKWPSENIWLNCAVNAWATAVLRIETTSPIVRLKSADSQV